MFNNRKFAAAATAVALGVCAVSAPQAQGATIGANNDGLCQITLNDQEKDEYERVAFASMQFNMDDNWRNAFEVAFPAAADIAAEFEDYYTGPEREAFNNDLMQNLNDWSSRISQETGVAQDASFWYFSQLWNSLATSSDSDLALVTYWDNVQQAIDSGEIVANEEPGDSVFAPVPPAAVLEQDRKTQFPELASHDAVAWTDAFENTKELKDYRLGAAFETVFNQASMDCAKGGDTFALFPTVDENPDAKRAAEQVDQGAIVIAPPTEDAEQDADEDATAEEKEHNTFSSEERDVTVNEDGSTTTRVVRSGNNSNVNISVTTRSNSRTVTTTQSAPAPKDENTKVVEEVQAAEPKSFTMDSGVIVAIVLAVLAALGGVAASVLG